MIMCMNREGTGTGTTRNMKEQTTNKGPNRNIAQGIQILDISSRETSKQRRMNSYIAFKLIFNLEPKISIVTIKESQTSTK